MIRTTECRVKKNQGVRILSGENKLENIRNQYQNGPKKKKPAEDTDPKSGNSPALNDIRATKTSFA